MTDSSNPHPDLRLTDSEMAARFRAFDWARTTLGPLEEWPRSLLLAVGICLNSRFPMFVWWGPELINIYNDAYAPILGQRHPEAFGRSAPTVWGEIWPVVGPQAEGVMERGEATWNERVLLVMERNGYTEETYFTWSYSPIPDEVGGIGGVFCACTEETPRVEAERERDHLLRQVETERARLAEAFAQSPAFLAVLRGPRHVFEFVNEQYLQLVGSRDLIGRPAREALPETAGQGFFELLDRVYQTGEPFIGTGLSLMVQRRPGAPLEEAFLDFVYQPMRGSDGAVDGILVHGVEVTEQKVAADALRESEARFRQLADAMPQIVFAATPDGSVDYFNRQWYEYTGLPEGSTGAEVWEQVHTEEGLRKVREVWPEAIRTGRPYEIEYPLRRRDGVFRWHLGRALPIRDGQGSIIRWFGTNTDIHDRKQIEQSLQESENRFRAMSDSAPVMIWVTGSEGQCEYLNKRWYEFTGQTEAIALGEGWLEAVHPEDVQFTLAAYRTATADRQPFTLEYRLRHRTGQYRWCVDDGTPRWSPGGELLGYIGTVVDIEDRKRIEEALESEKRVLERIATGAPLTEVLETIVAGTEAQSLDGMIASIFVLDEGGERLRLGAAPNLPPGYRQAIEVQPIGSNSGPCGTAAATREPVIATDLKSDPRWAAFRTPAEEGGLGACCATPILAGDGRLLGAVGAYYRGTHNPTPHDLELIRSATHLAGIVIERQEADRRLQVSLEAEQEARTTAERASRMKDEFLATLSHELRTPLNAILGWTQIMRLKPNVPPELVKGVDVIERNARAQAKIIEDLLDMSAIISGKVRLDVQRVDLAAIVQAAVDTARPTAEAKQIRIQSILDPLSDVAISGDPNRLQQILWNLLSNAIKFTPKDGKIQVVLERVGSHVEICISDTGEGIAPEFLPLVFDRFRQADASTTRRHGGLGLGLSIVKQLVELHGGIIRVASAGLGQGTTFTVELPLAPIQPVPPKQAGRRHPRTGELPSATLEFCGEITGLRVLVVDDEADARDLVRRFLEECEAKVSTASSAEEALKHLDTGEFDVLVSDIGMPGEDGYALIRRIRARAPERDGEIPAVALTAYARAEDRVKAIRAGFQMHLAKPVEPAELIATVASLGKRI